MSRSDEWNTHKQYLISKYKAGNYITMKLQNGQPVFVKKAVPESVECKISVIDSDSITTAYELAKANPGKKIAVLNFANHVRPALGAPIYNTQEEDLMRRTALPRYLYNNLEDMKGLRHLYPIEDTALLYSYDVEIIRDKKASIIPAAAIDIITAAALRNPPKTANDEYARNEDRAVMTAKIKLIIESAIQGGVRILVLGAFGCGAFNCPLRETARIFYRVIREHAHYFDEIVFPIPVPYMRNIFETELPFHHLTD